MLLVRSFIYVIKMTLVAHLALCGRLDVEEHCRDGAWSDVRKPFRILDCVEVVRMLCNAVSLTLQYRFPERGRTSRYGGEQLLYRACIRATGAPLHLVLAVQKLCVMGNPGWEGGHSPVEVAVDVVRGLVLMPIQSVALFHQWRYTGIEAPTEELWDSMGKPLRGGCSPATELRQHLAAVDAGHAAE